MAEFADYAVMLRDHVLAEIDNHFELRVGNYDAVIKVWIDADGRVQRVTVSKSTGIVKMDEGIRRAVAAVQPLPLPPPVEMPQPINLRIVSKAVKPAAP